MIKRYKFPVLGALVGIILGYASSQTFLAHSWIALMVWGLIGLVLGYLVPNKKQRYISGALFGLFLTESFLIFGFHGASTAIRGFIVLATVLGAVGAICGLVLFTLGNWIRCRITPKNPT